MAHAPLRLSRHNSSGFTLLELLVVLVIIGIILTMATLSVGGSGGQRQLHEEAQRLAALVSLASDEAVRKNEELLMAVEDNGYSFLVQDKDGKWGSVDEKGSLRPRELPEGLHLSVTVDEPMTTTPDENKEGAAAEPQPGQVWILSSGEMTPFTLTLRLDGSSSYTLHGDLIGNLTLDEPGAEKK